jgi:NADH-quinone oxidoreductase subunit N
MGWFLSIFPVTPNLLLILGSFLLLLVGVFSKRPNITARITCHAIALLVLSCVAIGIYFNGGVGDLLQGDWNGASYFDGELRVNHYSTFIKLLLIVCSMMVLIMMFPTISSYPNFVFELPILVLLSLSGALIMVESEGFMSFYLGLELMSLPSYVLASINRDNSMSTEGGLKYFILGSVSSAMFLFGISLIYAGDVYTMLPMFKVQGSHFFYYIIGYIFLVSSFAFKAAIFPGQMWIPDVYQGTPIPIVPFFATVAKIAVIFGYMKLLINLGYGLWSMSIAVISIISLFVGSLGAVAQHSIKRLLAYSGIVHMGFVLLGLIYPIELALTSSLLYLVIYIISTFGLFSCLILLRTDGVGDSISNLAGLSRTNPSLAFAISVFLFSMAGMPPLAGFFAKFAIIHNLLLSSQYNLAILAVVSTVISMYYYLYIVKIMYFTEYNKKIQYEKSLILEWIVILCVLFQLGYIFIATPVWEILEKPSQDFVAGYVK